MSLCITLRNYTLVPTTNTDIEVVHQLHIKFSPPPKKKQEHIRETNWGTPGVFHQKIRLLTQFTCTWTARLHLSSGRFFSAQVATKLCFQFMSKGGSFQRFRERIFVGKSWSELPKKKTGQRPKTADRYRNKRSFTWVAQPL